MARSAHLAPIEARVDHSEFLRLLQDRRNEILKREEANRLHLQEQLAAGEEIGDEGDGSVNDTDSDYYLQLADRDRRELHEVERALEKIRHGTYSECERCGNQVTSARLRNLPHARLCIDCQSAEEVRMRTIRPHPNPKL